jgi:hypothetical protein
MDDCERDDAAPDLESGGMLEPRRRERADFEPVGLCDDEVVDAGRERTLYRADDGRRPVQRRDHQHRERK